jgi:hypothetical protein
MAGMLAAIGTPASVECRKQLSRIFCVFCVPVINFDNFLGLIIHFFMGSVLGPNLKLKSIV